MSHTRRDKLRLLHRVRRLRGQLGAVERAIEEERGCAAVLHALAACRGALQSLLAEILEEHLREHVVGAASQRARATAARELIGVVRTYLK